MATMRSAAVIWLLGATVYLVCEAIAAAGHDGYSYTADYISDLGGHAVMNIGAFAAHGILFLAGAVLATRGYPGTRWVSYGFVFAAAANAVGNIVVAVIPSGSHPGYWHAVGAAMAIIGGNAAVIIAGVGERKLGAAPAFRWISISLGVAGIACLSVLVIDGANGSRVLPTGLVERGAVYPIIAWELMTSVVILGRGSR